MRVLHVIPSIARSEGGPSEVVRALMPELEQRGVSVRIVTTDKAAQPSDRDLLDNPNVVIARSLEARWTFAPGIIPILWREIGVTEIVHVHSIHTFPSTVAMLIARARGKPVILQPHGALNRYHISQRRIVKAAYLRTIDRIGLGAVRIALYSSQIEIADAQAVLPRVPAGQLPLGIESRIFHISREEASPPRVVFLARLAKVKRLDLLLRALASPALANMKLDAVIAGPIGDDLDFDPASMIDDLHLKRARLVGQVGPDERAQLLATASVFVLPSDNESFGISVAEAMGAGCAVICSPQVGVAIDARSTGAALIVEQDAVLLAQSIRRLLVRPDERNELGARARRYASENLTWPTISDRLVRYYSQATGALA